MKELVPFVLDDGSTIAVEVELDGSGEGSGLTRASRTSRATQAVDGVVTESVRRFDEVAEVIRPVAETIVAKLRTGGASPDTIAVQFGLKLTFSAGAIIAATAAEGNFTIGLTWTRHDERG